MSKENLIKARSMKTVGELCDEMSERAAELGVLPAYLIRIYAADIRSAMNKAMMGKSDVKTDGGFVEMMKRERAGILDRLGLLNDSRFGIRDANVSQANMALINRQLEVMHQYAEILTIRIELNEREVTK